jgi:hypothetical protein
MNVQKPDSTTEAGRRLALLNAAKTASTLPELEKSTGIPKSAAHRWVIQLHREGLLDRQGSTYVTSPLGLKVSTGEKFNHFPPSHLGHLWPGIELMPTSLHRAALICTLIAMAVRKAEIVEDLNISIVLIGRTQRLKSFLVKALCAMLRIDPRSIEIKMMQIRERSLMQRKDARGDTVYSAEVMKGDVVWLNECSRMDRTGMRDLQTLMHGTKNIKIDNDVFHANATPVLEMNDRKDGTLPERVGMDVAMIRRALIPDFSNVNVTKEMRVDSPEIIEKLKKMPPFILPTPENVKIPRETQLEIETAVENCLDPNFIDYIDVARIATLVRGLHGVLPWDQAVQEILYNVFLIYESTNFMLNNWRSKLAGQFVPRTQMPQPAAPASASASAPNTIQIVPQVTPANPAKTPQPLIVAAPIAAKKETEFVPKKPPSWSKNPFDSESDVLEVKAAIESVGLSAQQDKPAILAIFAAIKKFQEKWRPKPELPAILKFISEWESYCRMCHLAQEFDLTDEDLEFLAEAAADYRKAGWDLHEMSKWMNTSCAIRNCAYTPEMAEYLLTSNCCVVIEKSVTRPLSDFGITGKVRGSHS